MLHIHTNSLDLITFTKEMRQAAISNKHDLEQAGSLVQQVTKAYEMDRLNNVFVDKDLIAARNYLKKQVESLLVITN